MRTKSVIIGDDILRVIYPDYFVISHSPESYVRIHSNNLIKDEITLILRNDTYPDGVSVNRAINQLTGDAVFPIADMLDYLADMAGMPIAKAVDIILDINGNTATVFNITALIGATNEIIHPFNIEESIYLNNAPFPKTIPVYPNGPKECRVIPIFYPRKDIVTANVSFDDEASIHDQKYDGSGMFNISMDIAPGKFFDEGYRLVSISTMSSESSSLKILTCSFKVDTCSNGIFTRWTDRHGFPFFYRWDVEKVVEETENVDTYIGITLANLEPYDQDVKNSKMIYTLHSGMVEDEIYKLASSILSAQNIECYDEERGGWIHCTVNDGELENNLDEMKDVEIELVKSNRIIQ